MSLPIRTWIRSTARISGLVAGALLLAAVGYTNMAVAGIGGIGAKKGGLVEDSVGSGEDIAGSSVLDLEAAIRSGKSDFEIDALAQMIGYKLTVN